MVTLVDLLQSLSSIPSDSSDGSRNDRSDVPLLASDRSDSRMWTVDANPNERKAKAVKKHKGTRRRIIVLVFKAFILPLVVRPCRGLMRRVNYHG